MGEEDMGKTIPWLPSGQQNELHRVQVLPELEKGYNSTTSGKFFT